MAFDDKGWPVFPTRNGGAIGTAMENRMLGIVGGAGSIRTRIQTLPDGSTVRLKTRNGMPEFVIERLVADTATDTAYMTSGAYDIGPYFVNTPEMTGDFVVHKNGQVSGAESSTFTSFFKPALPESGAPSKIYTQSRQGATALTSAAYVLKEVPASNYTGLARRFFQGRYGCGAYTETTEGVSFGYDYANTTGVVRLGGVYWLVSLKTSSAVLSVSARKMTFPTSLQKRLAAAPSTQYDAIEVLCLGRSTISKTEVAVGTWVVPEGTPLAYGWKFSLSTNRADVVIRNSTSPTLDRHLWTHLSLVFNSGLDAPTCTLNTLEQVDGWMLAARSPIWVPGEKTMMANWRSTSPDPDTDQDCPIYCHYDGDTLRVYRWKFNKSQKTYSSDVWQDTLLAANTANSVYPVGATSASARFDWGGIYTFGMYSDDFSNVRSAGESSVDYEGTMVSYWADGAYGTDPDMTPPVVAYSPSADKAIANWFFSASRWTNLNPYVHPAGCATDFVMYPGVHNQYYRLYYVEARLNALYHLNSGQTFTTPMVIPKNDAAAVYLGYKESGTSQEVMVTSYLGGPGRCVEWDMDNDTGQAKGLWGAPVSAQVNLHNNNPILHGITKPDSGSTSKTVSFENYTLRLRINGSVIDVGNEASTIYSPTVDTRTLPIPVRAISPSLFAGFKCHSGTLRSGDAVMSGGGYPDVIDSFIGIA